MRAIKGIELAEILSEARRSARQKTIPREASHVANWKSMRITREVLADVKRLSLLIEQRLGCPITQSDVVRLAVKAMIEREERSGP